MANKYYFSFFCLFIQKNKGNNEKKKQTKQLTAAVAEPHGRRCVQRTYCTLCALFQATMGKNEHNNHKFINSSKQRK